MQSRPPGFRPRPAQTVVLSCAGVILLGALLLRLPAAQTGSVPPLSLTDAVFMSTSAVCVTGLSVVNVGADLTPLGHVILLVLVQVGALGYMVLATALISLAGGRPDLPLRQALRDLLGSPNLRGLAGLVRVVVVVTLATQLVGALLLAICFAAAGAPPGGAAWLGLFSAVMAFCNAGFDLFGRAEYAAWFGPQPIASLDAFVGHWAVCLIHAALIVAGGLGFLAAVGLWRWWRGGRRGLDLPTRMVLVISAVLLVAGTLLFYALERGNPATLRPLDEPTRWLAAFFCSTTCRTAGFFTVPPADLTPASKLVAIGLMVTGASPGGTGGGLKTTTLLVLLLAVLAAVRGEDEVVYRGREIRSATINRALAVLFGGLLVVGGLTLFLAIVEQHLYDSSESLMVYAFEAASAFGTVGLTCDVTPTLAPASRWAVCAAMIIGRVGPLTLAVALARRSRGRLSRYPEQAVPIG